MASPKEHVAQADTGEMEEVSSLWATEGTMDEDEGATGSETDPHAAENKGSDEESSDEDSKASEGATDTDETEEKKETDAKPAEAAAEVEVDFTPPAWINMLPEDVRASAVADFKNSRGSVKANALRVSALTKHLDETRRQLQAAQQNSTKMPEFKLPLDKSIEEVEREYPEIAAYVKVMQAQVQQQVAAHNASMTKPLIDAQAAQVAALTAEQNQYVEDIKNIERQRVRLAVPDVDTIVKDPNFGQWLDAQSPGVRSLISSPDADDNITLFSMYKGSRPVVKKKDLSEHVELPTKGKVNLAQQTDDENVDPVDLWNREYFSKK